MGFRPFIVGIGGTTRPGSSSEKALRYALALAAAEGAQEGVEDEVLRALDPGERAILRELLVRALRGAEPAEVDNGAIVYSRASP